MKIVQWPRQESTCQNVKPSCGLVKRDHSALFSICFMLIRYSYNNICMAKFAHCHICQDTSAKSSQQVPDTNYAAKT